MKHFFCVFMVIFAIFSVSCSNQKSKLSDAAMFENDMMKSDNTLSAKDISTVDRVEIDEAENAELLINDSDVSIDDIEPVDPEVIDGPDPNFEYKYLAIDPENCQITYCHKYPGYEDNGLACQTRRILDSGFYLGKTTYRIGKIIRNGNDCVYQGEEWTCILDKNKYTNYIQKSKLDCIDGAENECLIDTDTCKSLDVD